MLAIQVLVASLSRLFLNTARRFPYPFAPALSRGLGVHITAITSLIAANQITGILSVVFGPLGDRWGYRPLLLAGIGLLTIGMFTGFIYPFYAVILIALFMAGLGKNIFDPAIQAYVGAKVPYHKRGFIIGIMEIAWAGSSLLGLPLIGLLIDRFDWKAPFFVLGLAGLLSFGALWILFPRIEKDLNETNSQITLRSAGQLLFQKRSTLGLLGFAFFTSLAHDNFFVVYGIWLEDAFQLSIVALGMTATVIGAAELGGELLTAFMADRFGLKRSTAIGLITSGLCYFCLPFVSTSLTTALGMLFLIFLAFEFSIVASLALSTEALPNARATMMASLFGIAGLGRVVGDLLGGITWIFGGIYIIGIFSALSSGLALLCLIWGIRGWQPESITIRSLAADRVSNPGSHDKSGSERGHI